MKRTLFLLLISSMLFISISACTHGNNTNSSHNSTNEQEGVSDPINTLQNDNSEITDITYPLNGIDNGDQPVYSEGLSWAYYFDENCDTIYSTVYAAIDTNGVAKFVLPELFEGHVVYNINSFQDGVAIVETHGERSEIEGYLIIDKDGTVVWSSDPYYQTNLIGFVDGIALITVDVDADGSYWSSGDRFLVIDTQGNTLYSYTSTEEEKISPIGYGYGHIVLAKHVTTFSTNKTYIGTIDKNGNIRLSFEETDIWRYQEELSRDCYLYNLNGEICIPSIGYGVQYYLFNPDTREISEEESDYWYRLIEMEPNSNIYFENGIGFYQYWDELYRVTPEIFSAYVEKASKGYNLPKSCILDYQFEHDYFSDGLILGYSGFLTDENGKYIKDENGSLYEKYGYYDKAGNLAIDVTTSYTTEFGMFHSGYAAVRVFGHDGKAYITLIDTEGTQQYDLMPIRDGLLSEHSPYKDLYKDSPYKIYQSAGYTEVRMCIDSKTDYLISSWQNGLGEGVLIDPTGQLVTAGINDLTGLLDKDHPELNIYNGVLISNNNSYINIATKQKFNTISITTDTKMATLSDITY